MSFVYLLLILAGSLTVLYFIAQIFHLYQWSNIPTFDFDDKNLPVTSISVVIAARNEEEFILDCIYNLLHQHYPKDLLEIIVIDDQSEDNTYDLCEQIKSPNFKLMRLGVYKRTTIQGSKKKALAYGVSHARGKLVITTDGDCIHPPQWLHIIAQFYEKNQCKLMSGPVNVISKPGLLHQLQLLDFTANGLINAAGLHARTHYLGSGANLIFEQEVCESLKVFENNLHIASGDDIFLIQQFKKAFPNEIQFIKSKDCVVLTHAEKSFSSFFMQRLRWASKSRLTGDGIALVLASLVWLQRLTMWSLLIGSILYSSSVLFYSFLINLFTVLAIDFLIQFKACSFFECKKSLFWYVPAHVAHGLYFLGIGLLSWFPIPSKWKGRKI